MKSELLINILQEIQQENNRGLGLLANDESNERLLLILKKHLTTFINAPSWSNFLDRLVDMDNEEILESLFGKNGLHLIRDAEKGVY